MDFSGEVKYALITFTLQKRYMCVEIFAGFSILFEDKLRIGSCFCFFYSEGIGLRQSIGICRGARCSKSFC